MIVPKWAMKYGITNGTSSTSFTPGRTCSNAEILTMVYRAFEWMPVLGNNPLTDVKQSDYYHEAARWAAEYDIVSGVTNGTGATTFSPNDTCTRGQIVTFLYRVMG